MSEKPNADSDIATPARPVVRVKVPTGTAPVTVTRAGVSRTVYRPRGGIIEVPEGSRDLATLLLSIKGASVVQPEAPAEQKES